MNVYFIFLTLILYSVWNSEVNAHNVCGMRNIDGLAFRFDQIESEFGEFPWMIAVFGSKNNNETPKIICCGSLIHPKVILTAGNCVYKSKANELSVRAGDWDNHVTEEYLEHQDRQVEEIFIHEKFNIDKRKLSNDIALLITKIPFLLTDNVGTICLPPQNMNFDHSTCIAMGWIRSEAVITKVDLPVIPYSECQEKISGSALGASFRLHSSYICAGGKNGKNVRNGQGGGPLTCPIPGTDERYYQTGITAWGIGNDASFPGVFSSVSYFRIWIDKVMKSKQLGSNFYTFSN